MSIKVTDTRYTDDYNKIGSPYMPGYGYGVIPESDLPSGITPVAGCYNRFNPNFANYIHTASGSIMCYHPPMWVKYDSTKDPCVTLKSYDEYVDETSANSDGYYMPSIFKNNGSVYGILIDKYSNSKVSIGTGYGAGSVRYGAPLTFSTTHNPISDLTAITDVTMDEAINAPKTRDGTNGAINSSSIFFCLPYSAAGLLSFIELAQPKDSHYVAWKNGAGLTHFTKGCNDNSLSDTDDGALSFLTDGFSNCSLVGSGSQFLKTIVNGHNGECDVNGPVSNVVIGLTCTAVSREISNMAYGDRVTIATTTSHGLDVGDTVQLTGFAEPAELVMKMFTVYAVISATTFQIEVDPAGLSAYNDGGGTGYVTRGDFRVWDTDNDIKTLTSGTSNNTDMFYPSSTLFSTLEIPMVTTYPTNGLEQYFGNLAGAPVYLNNARGLAGIPEKDGLSVLGSDQYGHDLFYQYFQDKLMATLFGSWGQATNAGVRNICLVGHNLETSTGDGFRCATYVSVS